MLRVTRFSIISIAIFSFVLIAVDSVSAQLRLPRPSQKASVMQTLGVTDVTSIFYPGARHEILNETNRDEVMDDIVEWLDERLAARSA